MKDIYVMRHGETLFNYKLLLQGWCDAPLTPTGVKQAQAAGKYLLNHGLTLDHVYSSPAGRALSTVAILGYSDQVVCLPDLREWCFGLFEGESQKLFPHSFPYGDQLVPFHGESQEQVTTRIVKALNSIEQEVKEDTTTLVVAHTCVMRLFMQSVANHSLVEVPQKIGNCGMLHFKVDNGVWQLVEVIEHSI